MEMLDTNMVLRYLLDDNKEMADKAEKVIKNGCALVTMEVFAEIQTNEPEILKLGLETYAKHSLDFVDCILYAYNRVKGYGINTFDKKLKRLLEQDN